MPTWAPPSLRASRAPRGRLAPARQAAAATGRAAVAGPRGEGVERREGRRPGAWLRGEGDEDAGQRGEGGGMDARPQGSDARTARQQGEGCKDARPQGGGGGEACGKRGQPRGLVGNTLLRQGHAGARPCWLVFPTRPLSGCVTR